MLPPFFSWWVELLTCACPTAQGLTFYSKNFLLKNPLTIAFCFGRMRNCSARQSAYRASAGKKSEADKKSLRRKLSNLSLLGNPAFGGRQSSLTIELSMPRQLDRILRGLGSKC